MRRITFNMFRSAHLRQIHGPLDNLARFFPPEGLSALEFIRLPVEQILQGLQSRYYEFDPHFAVRLKLETLCVKNVMSHKSLERLGLFLCEFLVPEHNRLSAEESLLQEALDLKRRRIFKEIENKDLRAMYELLRVEIHENFGATDEASRVRPLFISLLDKEQSPHSFARFALAEVSHIVGNRKWVSNREIEENPGLVGRLIEYMRVIRAPRENFKYTIENEADLARYWDKTLRFAEELALEEESSV